MNEKPERWKSLADGLQALRLWETIGPEWPQIALLDLSNELYKQLQQNPKAFLDQYNIFAQVVQPRARCIELESRKGYAGRWIVIAFHRTASLSLCGSYPAEDLHASQSG